MIDLNAWAPTEVTDNADAGSKVLFRDYAADYVEKRCKVNNEPIQQTTKEKYQQYLRDYLNPVLGNKPMAAIRPADIRQWYDSMYVTKDGRGESIRRHVFELLDGIMSHAANAPLDDSGTTLIKRSPVQGSAPCHEACAQDCDLCTGTGHRRSDAAELGIGRDAIWLSGTVPRRSIGSTTP